MKRRAIRLVGIAIVALAVGTAGGTTRNAVAALPPGNAAQQWDKIAEDTVVASGVFQNEGLIYMGYVSSAMYRAVSPGERLGQSPEAAVTEAAYQVLLHYFPTQAATLGDLRTQALAAISDGQAKDAGVSYGDRAAEKILRDRADDGLMTPFGTTSSFPTLTPGPGVWRLTPAAYAPPQTPWVGAVKPFILESGDQFLPGPPPSLSSAEWVAAFNEIKEHGSNTNPNTSETSVARFWTANVIRQYNRLARSRDEQVAWSRRHRAARCNGEHSRRRRADLRHEREVPLLVLAPGHGDRSDLGQTGRRRLRPDTRL